MTIASETNKSGPYNGNGATTAFAGGFKIADETHVQVIATDADGVETIKTLTTHYTIAGVGDPTFTVTMLVAPASGTKLTLIRNVPFTQELDLENQGAYYAEDVEAAFDAAAARDQQLKELVDRSVKIPASADVAELDDLIASVILLGDSASDLAALAAVADEVVTLSAITANITTVAGISAAVTTVAGISAAVSTVAGVSTQITAIYTDLTALLAVPAAAAASASAASGSASAAAASAAAAATFNPASYMAVASYPTLVSLEGLALAQGDILYATAADTLAKLAKGTALQTLRMNAGASAPEWATATGATVGTAVPTTSGTSFDVTGVPAWVTRIEISFNAQSLAGTGTPTIQIGDAGGIETTGYLGSTGDAGGGVLHTVGFDLTAGSIAASVWNGIATLTLIDATTNTWAFSAIVGFSNGGAMAFGGGSKALSATLDRFRVTTVAGSVAFDAGKFGYRYS